MKGSRSIIGTAITLALLAGSTVAVTAQEEDAATSPPVEFTGHVECGPQVRTGTSEWHPDAPGSSAGLRRGSGDAWRQSIEVSDPRLEGDLYYSAASDEYRGAGLAAHTVTLRIENADGAWQGSQVSATLTDGSWVTASTVLVGESAYEGLNAIYETRYLFPEACAADIRGLIVEGDVPAAPEPFIPER